MTKCDFSIAWVGGCKNEAEPGSTNCKEHQKLCSKCRKKLIRRECSHAGQFVCGRPLCDNCKCPFHGM